MLNSWLSVFTVYIVTLCVPLREHKHAISGTCHRLVTTGLKESFVIYYRYNITSDYWLYAAVLNKPKFSNKKSGNCVFRRLLHAWTSWSCETVANSASSSREHPSTTRLNYLYGQEQFQLQLLIIIISGTTALCGPWPSSEAPAIPVCSVPRSSNC